MGAAKYITTMVVSAAVSRPPSTRRAALARHIRLHPSRATKTTAGTRTSSLRTFEKKRVRQTTAYGSPTSVATAAASPNEETKGPRMPAPRTNAATRGIVSKRVGAELSR